MRQIKFRAWDAEEKLMSEPEEFGYPFSFGSKEEGNDYSIDAEDAPHVDAIEIMQFTGLHDKNGKEIYEGDIVHEIMRPGNEEYHHLIEDITRLPLWEDAEYPEQSWEVVGNVYQNPELLNNG